MSDNQIIIQGMDKLVNYQCKDNESKFESSQRNKNVDNY